MTFTPTTEQQSCIRYASETSDNLLIQALAGAAKTSTLILLAEALPNTQILCLAFNKKIAVEMTERLPSNCTASTLNALGHRIWADMIGTRLDLNTRKMYGIVSDKVKDKPNGADKDALWKGFKELLATAKEAKSRGYIPPNAVKEFAKDKPNPLLDEETFYANCEYALTHTEQMFVNEVVTTSIKQSLTGTIDFDDQIYMPSCFRAIFPTYPLVMVDEAQDLSSLNHQFLKKLVRKRLIAVGDPCQAIYGFRGAHETSMALMQKEFSMTKLALTTTFRCPEAIVDHVRWRAPEMQSWKDNPRKGKVSHLSIWELSDLPDHATVICRNNAPLYRLAILLLKNGRTPKLVASDIGKALITIMKKLGPVNMKRDDAHTEIKRWLKDRESRSRARKTIHDQAECMGIFLDATDTLGQAIHFATSLLNYEGAIQLMTGHKSKGMEFPDVYFLDSHLLADEGQDLNLRYVIATRTTDKLTYLTLSDCLDLITGKEVD